MSDPDFVLLYVKNPAESAALYADLLGKAPVDSSPHFVMFALESGVKLGLWAANDVQPEADAAGGGELAFTVGSKAAVRELCEHWRRRGLRVVQPPVQMDFGHTATAVDPDGHRLRVFAPGAAD